MSSAVDVEAVVFDARVHLLDGFEHDRAPAMLHQRRRCSRRLDHRAVGREIAAQHRDARVRLERIGERSNHALVPSSRTAARLYCFPTACVPFAVSASLFKLAPSSRITAGNPPA